jgi:hypothetical protein
MILEAVPVTFLRSTSRQAVTKRTSLDYAEALGPYPVPCQNSQLCL